MEEIEKAIKQLKQASWQLAERRTKMKMHKMSFTSDQLGTILDALGFAINDNYSMSDPTNAHIQRIINKIEKELKNDNDFDFSPIETEEA